VFGLGPATRIYVALGATDMRKGFGTCFDIGVTVRKSLESYLRTGEPFAGSTDPFTAGNGSFLKKETRVRSRDYNNPPTPHRMFCKFVSPRNLWKWNSLGNVEA
jgi:hypothetical protein